MHSDIHARAVSAVPRSTVAAKTQRFEKTSETAGTPPRFEDLDIPPSDKGTSVSKEEAEFMHGLVARLRPKATLEVGFGYGASTAFIVSGARVTHYVMDPFQQDYGHRAIGNLRKLGLDSYVKFFPDYSHSALPQLLQEGVRVDFAFIDGGHRFDDIFVDFYYTDLLLEQGGHILLHDAWMRSTQHVASWIKSNKRNYTVVPTERKNLILFRKRGEDDRAWNHFCGFTTFKSLWSHSANTWKRQIRAKLGKER